MIEGSEEWRGDEGGGGSELLSRTGREQTQSKDKQKKAADGFTAAVFGSSTWPDATKIY